MPRTRKGHGSDPRITSRQRVALAALVEDGATIEEASDRAGLKVESLRKALKKPHVVSMRAEMRAALRDNSRDRAFRKITDLSHGARSEYVQLDASKIVMQLAGENPAATSANPANGGGIRMNIIIKGLSAEEVARLNQDHHENQTIKFQAPAPTLEFKNPQLETSAPAMDVAPVPIDDGETHDHE